MAPDTDEWVGVDWMRELAQGLPVPCTLRQRSELDLPFLAELYASTREQELRAVGWPPAQQRAFLDDQFSKQHRHYLQHYPRAQWLVICHGSLPAGRLYIEQTRQEIRLMDISLLPAFQNQGIGSTLMDTLLACADRLGLPVTLHVEPFNPALRLYVRLGFEVLETRGVYHFMQRSAPASPLS